MSTPVTDPTAYADQLDAATRHAHALLHTAAQAGRGDLVDTPAPDWLAAHGRALLASLTGGTARLCAHLLGGAPRLAHAAVWAPGILVCPACTQHLRPAPGEDFTCDRCHHPVDTITAGVAALGPILLGYGLCEPCLTAADPDADGASASSPTC